jgi:DNA-binding IclR family transcriptional regulator
MLTSVERTELLRELDLVVCAQHRGHRGGGVGVAVHNGRGASLAGRPIAVPSSRFRDERIDLPAGRIAALGAGRRMR